MMQGGTGEWKLGKVALDFLEIQKLSYEDAINIILITKSYYQYLNII